MASALRRVPRGARRRRRGASGRPRARGLPGAGLLLPLLPPPASLSWQREAQLLRLAARLAVTLPLLGARLATLPLAVHAPDGEPGTALVSGATAAWDATASRSRVLPQAAHTEPSAAM